MDEAYQKRVRDYYDYTLRLYRLFWHGDTRAVHYGIWDDTTNNLHEALLNTNKFLAGKADVQRGEKILDAGCGVGGSAFWLAQNRGVYVTGITISEKQLTKARELAKERGLEKATEFYLKDYTNTGFADASFDVVWAIESVCYAESKAAFLEEAYRLLRPGGRLIVADGFIAVKPQSQKEKTELKNFLIGLALKELASVDGFAKDVQSVGFKNTQRWDKTKEILPTSLKMFRMSLWSTPLSKLTGLLHFTPRILEENNKAGIDQYDLFKNGVLSYSVFLAEK